MQSRILAVSLLTAAIGFISPVIAQVPVFAQPQARILKQVDESSRVTLTGNVHPVAAVATASTETDPGTPMDHMILYLKGDATQEAQLTQLIAQQHDSKAPMFHRYLTPQDFAAQFGIAASDLAKVSAWLQSKGFQVEEAPAGNRAIVFSGTSAQVQNAFKTEIRSYVTAGVSHIANASDPQIPASLAGIVGGIVKLHNFQHSANISKAMAVSPQFNYGSSHYLSPADYATIYNINPSYTAGINGASQTIAVIARSNIHMTDVQSFRSQFGLAANNPQIVLTSSDPGVLQGDSVETTLDTEWAGAIAPNAAVKVIVAASTSSADGIDLSALYAVNHNVAPVISLSYGSCEAAMGSSELAFYNSLWQQAAAQGISVMVSSGDSGAAGCNSGSSNSGSMQAINGLCSSPYATCVGGTQFVEGSNPGQYWLAGNNPTYGSAISYIPETVWNESASNGGSGLWAGGGGASITYPKPTWQTGPGVPADGKRDVPDVSLTASGHDGYLIVYGGGLNSVGGTSASAPSFAGLMALVNQKTNARQGLANTVLYPLAANQASGGAAVFHDTVNGNNSVPGVAGFIATTGYDRATGLGSVDATALLNHWSDGPGTTDPLLALTASVSTTTIKAGQSAQVTVTSKASSLLKSSVTLAVSGLPAGVTGTFGTNPISLPGSGSSVLSIAVASSATPGTYSLTVTGTGGGQVAKLAISLVIPTPTFSLSASTSSVSVTTGGKGTATFSIASQNGFSASVALSVSGLPTGVTGNFSPASINGANGGATTLILSAASSMAGGSYQLTISAAGGGVTQTSNVTMVITVPAHCTLGVNPGTFSIHAGDSSSAQVTCGSVTGNFSGPLSINLAGVPAGVTTQFSSGALTAGSALTLNINSSLITQTGNFNLSLTASGSGFTQTVSIPLNVAAANTFVLTTGQSTLTLKPGFTAQTAVISALYGSFNSAVALSVTGLPAGVTASMSNATLAAPGSGTSMMTFNAATGAKPGTYVVSITGISGGVTRTVTLPLMVQAAQDFTLAVNASSLSMPQNGGASVIVSTGNFSGGFNSTITINFSGLAPGMNWAVMGANTGNNLVNITDRFTAANYTPPGVYPVTITASGAGIVHTVTVMMTVTAVTQAKR